MSLAAPPDYNFLPAQGTKDFAPGPTTGVGENFGASYDVLGKVDSALGVTEMWREELEKRDEEIHKLTGKRLGVYYTTPEFGDQYRRGLDEYAMARENKNASWATMQAYKNAVDVERQVDELRKQYPQLKSREDIFKVIQGQRQGLRDRLDEVSERAGFMGTLGMLAGGVAGSFTYRDPFNVATLPIGGFGKTAVTRIGTEALTQMTIEGINQSLFVKPNAEAMGEEYTAGQYIANVLFAGAGAAVFRGATEGGAAIYKRLTARAQVDDATGKAIKDVLSSADPNEAAAKVRALPFEQLQEISEITQPVRSTAQRGAELAAELEEFTSSSNPFSDVGAKLHTSILQETAQAIEEGRGLPIVEMEKPVRSGFEMGTFDVKSLTVDAKAMQFKSGGDAQGVTERLQGVKEWNPFLAGVVTVFEKADGTRVVADGHQRVGLAKRLVESGAKDKINIHAFVIREKEGYSMEYARAVAALKNIGEGSGTALDAAKVFRDMPAGARAVQESLPPNSALVRDGRALAGLDNEAYMMVKNGVVDEKIGAVVGRLEAVAERQRALMGLLAKEEPDTIYQAEQIVRQAQAAGFDTKEQATLFGADNVTESLFKAKAKTLERALRIMREDKAVFRKLTEKRERISEVGNILDQAKNAGELASTEAILRTVEALAYRKGAVADLLTQFAKEGKDNGRYKTAAGKFVTALRSRLDEGGLSGLFADAPGDIPDVINEVAGRAGRERAAAAVEATEKLDVSAPQDIETGFNNLLELAKRQTKTPSRSKSESGASSARAKSSKEKLEGTQRPPRQATTRKLPASEPSEIFSTAKIEPSSTRGASDSLGMTDSKTGKKILHTVNDAKALHKQAKEHLEPMREWLMDISADIPGVKLYGARVKDLAEAVDKAGKHERPANQISDYLGARFVADTTDDIAQLVKRLRENAQIIDYEDFLAAGRNGKGTGYRAIHLQATTRDGFSYEVQILPREIADVYEQARVPYAEYKKYRDKKTMPPEIYKAYKQDMKAGDALFDDAWQKFQERDELERAMREFNVEEEIPVALEFDAEGKEVVRTMKLGALLDEIDGDEKLTKAMTECLL